MRLGGAHAALPLREKAEQSLSMQVRKILFPALGWGTPGCVCTFETFVVIFYFLMLTGLITL